jgi:DNA-binding transcriptional LysR family regulator
MPERALIAAKAGVRIAQAIGRGDPQELELAYSTVVDPHLIAQIKTLAEDGLPLVPVRFRSSPPDLLVERLFDGASHAAIAILPVYEDVASTCLLREELFALVPAAHRLADRSNLTIAEIGADPVIWGFGVIAPAFTKDVFNRFRHAGYIPNVTHDAQTIAESLGLVREGLGITFVKTSDRHLIGEGLTMLPLTTAFPVETGLLYVRERRSKLINDFVSLVTKHIRPEPLPSTSSGAPLAEA